LREDLALLKCDMICWNWSIPAAGVICRMDRKLRSMFKFSKSFPDLMQTIADAEAADSCIAVDLSQ